MKKNNVNIYVFTGTGNTLIAADKIAEIFNKHSYAGNVYRMEAVDPKNIDKNSTIAIGFTVACWNTYPFVRQWIDNLPDGNETEIILFCTMGDSSFNILAHIAKILEAKNYKIIAARDFLMPNNFLLVSNEQNNIKKTNRSINKAEEFVKQIISSKHFVIKTNFISNIAFVITNFIITKLWNAKLSKKIMKFKIDKNKCTKCGICADICPVNNIKMNKFPEFKDKCQFCLRCVSYCPLQAMSNKILFKTYRALPLEKIKWK